MLSKCFVIEKDLSEETKSVVCMEVTLFMFLWCVSYRSPGRSSFDNCGEGDEILSKSISFTHESISRVSETEQIDGNPPSGVSVYDTYFILFYFILFYFILFYFYFILFYF